MVLIAMLLSLLCAAALYVASPHQKMFSTPPARVVSSGLAVVSGLGGLVMLLVYFGPATAMFVFVTLLTLVWSTLPLVLSYTKHLREEGLG